MENISDLIKESNDLLDNLYKNVDTKKISSQDELRAEVANFVVSQMNRIQKQDALRGLIEAELAQKIVLHELSTDELVTAYSTISREKSNNTISLLDIFKPTNASPNSLITPPREEEEKTALEYTPAQRQAIEKLTRVIEAIELQKEKMSGGAE